jgi:hypothetical protein
MFPFLLQCPSRPLSILLLCSLEIEILRLSFSSITFNTTLPLVECLSLKTRLIASYTFPLSFVVLAGPVVVDGFTTMSAISVGAAVG